jgi:hypothetical protein
MKVYIGPHKNWFGPYQLAELLCFWVKEEKDEHGFSKKPDWVHNFGEWLAHGEILPETNVWRFDDKRKNTWLYSFLLWIIKKQKRTVKIRIDSYDTWNMDGTLSMIILPMLKQLKATKHGSPFVDDEDVPENLRSTSAPPKENEWDTDENHFKRWDWVLDEMIWAFEQLQPDCDWEQQYYTGEHDTYSEACAWDESGKPTMYEMKHGPNDTFKADYDAIKVHAARIKNGTMLFGKYYQGLWD